MQSNSLSKQLISSRVTGMLVLVFIEIMFFSALISSFFVMKRGREIWDTAGSVPLPVLATGFNTAVLIASGLSLFFAGKALRNNTQIKSAAEHLFRTLIMGGFFLAFQLYLVVQLVNAGLTIHSSVFAGCFHLIVGAHLLQVTVGLGLMIQLYRKMSTADLTEVQDRFNSLQIFWLFVLGMWPVLYAEMYF